MPPFPFASLVLSVDFKADKNASLFLEMQICKGKQKSPWQQIAYFRSRSNASFINPAVPLGKTETDVFICKTCADNFKYRLFTKGKVKINKLNFTVTKYKEKFNAAAALAPSGLAPVELKIKPLSQMALKNKDKNRLCSPVCLKMLLDYYGVKKSVEEVAAAVYDHSAGIYGNWVFNTAYAAQNGLSAAAARANTLAELEELLSSGIPVPASVSFKKGGLKNAPLKETKGHFVLVTGFDKKGNIITLDPAAPSDKTVRRVYDRKEFADSWLKNKKGLFYLITEK